MEWNTYTGSEIHSVGHTRSGLVSIPTRSLCAANHLYFLCSLGKHSAAFFLARDGEACTARPGPVAEKGELPRTLSIYATDTRSGRVGEAKYKRRDAKNNMRGCKLRNATSAANANMNAIPSFTRLPSSFYPPPFLLCSPQLGTFRLSQLSGLGLSRFGDLGLPQLGGSVHLSQLGFPQAVSASFSSLADYCGGVDVTTNRSRSRPS